MAAVKIGVLGGTFDPIHIGHLVLAEHAREELGLDRVVFVPAGDPWRKAGAAVSAAAHRLAMVLLAIEGNQAFEVSTTELEREGPSYTVDTLYELKGRHAGAELYFLMGLDALMDLPNWHEPAQLIERAMLGVAARDGQQPGATDLDRLLSGLSARVRWLSMPRLEISGTELRRRAGEGRSIRYRVPDAVDAYIEKHALYRP